MPRVDAHHHYWHASTTAEHGWSHSNHEGTLRRDFLPKDLESSLGAVEVSATVLVQSANTFAENDRLQQFAETTQSVAGVVGYLPIGQLEQAINTLDSTETERWCGVRSLIGGDPLDWLSDRKTLRIFEMVSQRNLVWDVVVVNQEQAAAVAALAATVPDLRIVVDHLARPPLKGEDPESWRRRVGVLAAHPNVAMKVSVGISALTAWGVWKPSELKDSVAEVVDRFTPERLMQASNWPVSLLGARYERQWRDITTLLAKHLTSRELSRVQGGTATTWYGLELTGGESRVNDP